MPDAIDRELDKSLGLRKTKKREKVMGEFGKGKLKSGSDGTRGKK